MNEEGKIVEQFHPEEDYIFLVRCMNCAHRFFAEFMGQIRRVGEQSREEPRGLDDYDDEEDSDG